MIVRRVAVAPEACSNLSSSTAVADLLLATDIADLLQAIDIADLLLATDIAGTNYLLKEEIAKMRAHSHYSSSSAAE